MVSVCIDGRDIEVQEDKSVLEAALNAGIYIPHLCYHPATGSSESVAPLASIYQGSRKIDNDSPDEYAGCNLCLVEIEGNGGPVNSCNIAVKEGMVIHTDSPELKEARRKNLAQIIEKNRHPITCITCKMSEGCDRIVCAQHTPEDKRCCWKYHNCEFREVASYIGLEDIFPPVPAEIASVRETPFFTVDYRLCIGCMRCVQVCRDISKRGALGFVYSEGKMIVGTVEPAISGCETTGLGEPPCKGACPAGVDVRGYMNLAGIGKFDEALSVVRERMPFASVCGRICYHPCESSCSRGQYDDPLAICETKRFLGDRELGLGRFDHPPLKERREEKVAIIGAGPAGLAAAYYLALEGFQVTIFEKLPIAGGMLAVGIPEYRLPRNILSGEIANLQGIGVQIRTGVTVGRDLTLEKLKEDGFKAFFVATGMHKSMPLGIDGEDLDGVVPGTEFLRKISLKEPVAPAKRAVIIGGGNVAIDCARSALRLGAEQVTILYRRSRAEMPAYSHEVEDAEKEGIHLHFLAAPTRLVGESGKLKGIEYLKMALGEPDESGRRRPVPIKGSETMLEADQVIPAIGQAPDADFLAALGVEADRQGRISVHDQTLATSRSGFFAGGDCTLGPASFVEAVAQGRKAADSILSYLSNGGSQVVPAVEKIVARALTEDEGKKAMSIGRQSPAVLPLEKRTGNFNEVGLGLTEEQVIEEGKRCLNCSLCTFCMACADVCPTGAIRPKDESMKKSKVRMDLPASILPPSKEEWFALNDVNLAEIPEVEGVFRLADQDKVVVQITGSGNLKEDLAKELRNAEEELSFNYEVDPMFMMRERQVIQQYIAKHGDMPRNNKELDDLF